MSDLWTRGLWLDQLWAEYLTVIATSLLLPYELVHSPSLRKAAGITVNLAIVRYLGNLLGRRVRRPRPLEPRSRLDELSP